MSRILPRLAGDIGLSSLHTLEPSQAMRIRLAVDKTDMRCGFDRLAERVKKVIGANSLNRHLFVFHSRRRDRLKILALCLVVQPFTRTKDPDKSAT